MKGSSSVLVFTNYEQSDLTENLLNMGYAPLIRKKMMTTLKEVQHKCIAVIFLDLKYVEIDTLEFILNVRDIDQYLPVVIVNGKQIEGEKQILHQGNIFFISNTFGQIKKILNIVFD